MISLYSNLSIQSLGVSESRFFYPKTKAKPASIASGFCETVALVSQGLSQLPKALNHLVHVFLGVGERNQPLLIKPRRGDDATVDSP